MATKFNQKKAKLHRFRKKIQYIEIFLRESQGFEDSEFNYAIRSFEGGKGVTMALKFR